jgi:hypothetical protein
MRKKRAKISFLTNSKNLLIALLIIAAAIATYTFAQAAVVSHSSSEITGPIDATTLQGLAAADFTQNGVPEGAIMFFNSASCPDGWSDVTDAQGRYIVGLQDEGTIGATVGEALAPQENRMFRYQTGADYAFVSAAPYIQFKVCQKGLYVPKWLVNNRHTEGNCVGAEGAVVGDGSGNNMCRFSTTSCPIGWSQYLQWSTTISTRCQGNSLYACDSCSTGSHAWSNKVAETCDYTNALSGPWCEYVKCTSTKTYVGCY